MSNRKLPDIPLPSFETAAISAASYRTAAGRLRKIAQQSVSPRSRADMLALVTHYERMAAHFARSADLTSR